MADDPTDTPDDGYTPPTGDRRDETPSSPPPPDGDRLVTAKLRAKIAELRHWCRGLLDDPATAGAIPDAVADELRSTPPAMSTGEAFGLYLAAAQGRPIPPDHPALKPAGTDNLAALRAERERLRQAYFALLDRIDPFDITEEELLEMKATSTEVSISELISEFERENGGIG